MSTILFVEDNPDIMKINVSAFKIYGYTVFQATNAYECENILKNTDIDIIVLDILLPDKNGLELCKSLKSQYDIPIIFVSALGENDDVVAGLQSGGDDYLSKPYDLNVLKARVEARLRFRHKNNHFIYFGDLKLDMISMKGFINGNDLLLTQKEYQILMLLIKKDECPITKDYIYKQIWGYINTKDNHALYTTISRLKKKLYNNYSQVNIVFIRPDGYIIENLN